MNEQRKAIEDKIIEQMNKADEQAKYWNHQAARLRYVLWGLNHPNSLEVNDYKDWLKYNMPEMEQ